MIVTFFGNALFHLWLRFVKIQSFMISWRWISSLGLGVCFAMVGYLFFSGVNGGSPWAESPPEGATHSFECALGRNSSDVLVGWQLLVGYDAEGAARRVAAEPDVWTDGSLVEDKVSGASSAGAGCFTYCCSHLWAGWRWGHLDEDVGDDAVVSACRGLCSVPGLCSLFKELNFGVLFLLCRLMMRYILGLTILGLFSISVNRTASHVTFSRVSPHSISMSHMTLAQDGCPQNVIHASCAVVLISLRLSTLHSSPSLPSSTSSS